MSELQLSLLAIGAVVIVAVVVYNRWQEAQYRKSAERSFELKHGDALLDPAPAGEAAPDAAQRPVVAQNERREPFLGDAGGGAAVEAASPPAAPRAAAIDTGPLAPIDHILRLESARAVESSRLIELAVKELAEFSKPVQLEGLDIASGAWLAVGHGGSFSNVRAGIQLVDRQGPVSAEELTRFNQAVERMAAALDAKVESATQAESLERAARLDKFCENVDVQIAVNVVSPRAFEASRLFALADASGLVAEGDGKFYRRDAKGHVLFTMSGSQGTALPREARGELNVPAVMLEIDVPRTLPDLGAFDALQAFADDISETMDAKIVDDNQVVIEEPALKAIRGQLERIYSEMTGFGIPAGSSVAFRLFS
jgi:FtsZ-interacting cell division protein ZipA